MLGTTGGRQDGHGGGPCERRHRNVNDHRHRHLSLSQRMYRHRRVLSKFLLLLLFRRAYAQVQTICPCEPVANIHTHSLQPYSIADDHNQP